MVGHDEADDPQTVGMGRGKDRRLRRPVDGSRTLNGRRRRACDGNGQRERGVSLVQDAIFCERMQPMESYHQIVRDYCRNHAYEYNFRIVRFT